jgi:hypothetical protein
MTAGSGGADVAANEGKLILKKPPADDFDAVLKKAQAGDEKALRRAAEFMAEDPDIVAQLASYATGARNAVVKAASRENPLVEAALLKRVAAMRDELLPEPAPLLERMLVERVLVTWVRMQHAAAVEARLVEKSCDKGGVSFRELEFLARTHSEAQRRHLQAVKTLVQVRRLAIPPQLNVNLAQVNVANVNTRERG